MRPMHRGTRACQTEARRLLACDRRVLTQELRDNWGPYRRRIGIVDEEMPVVLERRQQVKFGVAASRRPCLVKPLGKGRPKERVVLRVDHQERNPRRAAELTCRRHKVVGLAIVVRLPPKWPPRLPSKSM